MNIGSASFSLMQDPWKLVPAQKLPAGATLGLFSPSEPLTPPRWATLVESLTLLEERGYIIKFAGNAKELAAYAAGNYTKRVADMHALAKDPEVDALLATWGGKSCNQLLRHLDFALLGSAGKPLIGFSDVAVLQNALTIVSHLASFHFLTAGRLPETEHLTMESLHGSTETLYDVFDFNGADLPRRVFRAGSASGRLFGGNLSTFVLGLVGTPYLDEMPSDVVFFWESASERPQIIDQHLTTLRNAGFMDRVRAMVIGSAYSGRELRVDEIGEAIKYCIEGYDFPVMYSPSFGHLPTRNPVVPIGSYCTVDTGKFLVSVQEPIVQ